VEKFLNKCIDSILSQTFADFELILVDDGSPDGCPQICDEYAINDNRIKVIHKQNGGLASARNTGLFASIGEYIVYVDGDDWLEAGTLQVLIEKAINGISPDIVVYGLIKDFGDHREAVPFFVERGLYNKELLIDNIYPYMIWDKRKPFYKGFVFPTGCGKVFKRCLLQKHYCKNEKIRMGEDAAFVYECLYNANTVYFLPEKLYVYNQLNEASHSHSYDPKRFENNRYLVDYIQDNLGGIDSRVDDQINSFKAYWLIMAIFHEIKSKRPLAKAREHIKEAIDSNNSIDDVTLKNLPLFAKFYVLLVKARLFFLALIAAKTINACRNS
jgi:glycosyltransferase involved in cell wall biosynthesis